MIDSVIIIVATVAVLLLMAVSFLFIYFRSIRHELELEWHVVLANLRLRLDMIPNLLETVKQFAPQENKAVDELVKLRSDCWPMERADKSKVHKELSVSTRLRGIRALAKKYPELARDTNFLALGTDFRQVSAEIEKNVENYNNHVRKYNRKVRFILFMPISMLFGFPKMTVFEFEP